MSPTAQWIVPASGAQVAYPLSIFGEKAVLRRGHVDAGALATGAALLNVVVAAALLAAFGVPDASGADQLVLVGCGGLLYVYLVPYLRAIELDDVSSVVPLFQVVPVLTLALSLALGRADVSTTELAGAAVVSLGTGCSSSGTPVAPVDRAPLRCAGCSSPARSWLCGSSSSTVSWRATRSRSLRRSSRRGWRSPG